MRLLGIDYGEKRVGVALTDETGHFAMPFEVLENNSRLVDEIAALCREQGVSLVVLGESKDWHGQDNLIMKRVSHFKRKLEEATNLPVILEPEILTSVEAERVQGPTALLDASAAALILKSYLDKQ